MFIFHNNVGIVCAAGSRTRVKVVRDDDDEKFKLFVSDCAR